MNEEIKEWKLVPVEPTKNMLKAGTNGANSFKLFIAETYKLMLAAAPTPPQEPACTVSMEPVGRIERDGELWIRGKLNARGKKLKHGTKLYSAEQLAIESLNYAERQNAQVKNKLATLQVENEKLRGERDEFVKHLKFWLPKKQAWFGECWTDAENCIAKHEGKSS